MTAKTVTIVGSYNVGLFLKGGRLPVLGETIIADKFKESGGGKGSNQAVAAATLGASTRFIGRIGDDKYGADALEMYKKLHISKEHVKIDKTIHTGISVILIDEAGHNLISVVPGANLRLSREDLDSAESILKSSFIVGFQLENDPKTVIYGIRKVHALRVKTFLDPAPAVKLPADLYPCLDFIKPNETEATILTSIQVVDPRSAEKAGRWFLDQGVKTAIITLGAAGAVLVTENHTEHYPAPEVQAIDSTGAGDIFSGGFLAKLSAGSSVVESIVFAVQAASLSTTRLGVIESIPSCEEVLGFMKKSPGKL
jgi:ribokinase